MRPFAIFVALLAALIAASAGSVNSSADAAGTADGILRVVLSSDIDYIDPSLDYLTTGWEIQYAVACKLLNYPDADGSAGSRLRPEVAAAWPRVSSDGKTYTFAIRSGFRFSNGEPVTATSFADAFNRDANPALQSPSQSFIADIVGVEAVLRGQRKTISGIRVANNEITFKLTRPAPDFMSRVAMPFFQAIPDDLRRATNPAGVSNFASCGPYYVASWVRGRSLTIKRN